ncbi:arginine N-succinyltransferase [Thaumasiovibrio subtropicus]|uniref:arginine N-succinyltransferase n=1 Tax=Thaumasiovibrio subtropicus TaxID=1891207 RepID=UPI000B35483E|nr:arginine N-succinyltransferase [Thaumasiovibrio subtropicus]
MLVIRPITMADYPALLTCAKESGHGFTSLPVSEELLKKRIAHSEQSFAQVVDHAGDQGYLMVAEDISTGDVVGTTAIEAAIGLDVPFYSYHLSKVVHSSPKLGVHNVVEVLALGNHYTGCTEICTLFLRERWRKGLNGKLMSKCRFLMLAEHPERFSETVFAEMRGVSDPQGNSPFWAWLKEHFFSIDFTLADHLTGIGKKGFIADLMPKHPIYVSLLSKEAQAVIGHVHDNTRPALRLLEQEGFSCRGYVDIFDGGPTVECERRHIESVRHSFQAQVEVGDVNAGEPFLVCNSQFADFRATAADLHYDEKRGVVVMGAEIADALLVEAGETVRLLAMHE